MGVKKRMEKYPDIFNRDLSSKKEKPIDGFCGLSLLIIALVISAIDIEKIATGTYKFQDGD